MTLLGICEDRPPGHGQQQDLPCHSWVITVPPWDHGSSRKEWMAALAPQGQCSWQKERLNQPQLLRLLNSTAGEEGDTPTPEVLHKRLGNIPLSL